MVVALHLPGDWWTVAASCQSGAHARGWCSGSVERAVNMESMLPSSMSCHATSDTGHVRSTFTVVLAGGGEPTIAGRGCAEDTTCGGGCPRAKAGSTELLMTSRIATSGPRRIEGRSTAERSSHSYLQPVGSSNVQWHQALCGLRAFRHAHDPHTHRSKPHLLFPVVPSTGFFSRVASLVFRFCPWYVCACCWLDTKDDVRRGGRSVVGMAVALEEMLHRATKCVRLWLPVRTPGRARGLQTRRHGWEGEQRRAGRTNSTPFRQ